MITQSSGILCTQFRINSIREDIKKKTVERVKTALLGGRGSEKLLNFHHLQMMKNMEGGGVSE